MSCVDLLGSPPRSIHQRRDPCATTPLAIVLLTSEDDCSAPANTALYSLNVGGSNQQNIANALGPLANYRCNQFLHLGPDPNSATPTPSARRRSTRRRTRRARRRRPRST